MKANKAVIAAALVASIVVVAGLMNDTSVAAAANTGSQSAELGYQNADGTAAPDQCAKPVSQRVGGWQCVAASTNAVTPKVITPNALPTVSDSTGTWIWNSTVTTSFSGKPIVFGYGKKSLGTTLTVWRWDQSANSGNMYVTGNAISSTATANNRFGGALYNGSKVAQYGGSELSVCGPWNTNIIQALPNQRIYSNQLYCGLGDQTMYDHNFQAEYDYQVPGYPGRWYEKVRSPVAHAPKPSNGDYRFSPTYGISGDRFKFYYGG